MLRLKQCKLTSLVKQYQQSLQRVLYTYPPELPPKGSKSDEEFEKNELGPGKPEKESANKDPF